MTPDQLIAAHSLIRKCKNMVPQRDHELHIALDELADFLTKCVAVPTASASDIYEMIRIHSVFQTANSDNLLPGTGSWDERALPRMLIQSTKRKKG